MKEDCARGKAVSAGASNLLVIADKVLRTLKMDDKSDVGFIVPHAKLNGCCQYSRSPIHEAIQIFARNVSVVFISSKARVVGENRDAVICEKFCNCVACIVGQTVDDPLPLRQNGVICESFYKPGESLLLRLQWIDLYCKIRPNQIAPNDG